MRGMQSLSEEDKAAIAETAQKLGVSPADLTAVMGFETKGTMNPDIVGGTNNHYQGLIQFGIAPNSHRPGESIADHYGYKPGMSIAEQVRGPVYAYLKDRGVKAGDGVDQLYQAINPGGGKFVKQIKGQFVPQAQQVFSGFVGPDTQYIPQPRVRPEGLPAILASDSVDPGVAAAHKAAAARGIQQLLGIKNPDAHPPSLSQFDTANPAKEEALVNGLTYGDLLGLSQNKVANLGGTDQVAQHLTTDQIMQSLGDKPPDDKASLTTDQTPPQTPVPAASIYTDAAQVMASPYALTDYMNTHNIDPYNDPRGRLYQPSISSDQKVKAEPPGGAIASLISPDNAIATNSGFSGGRNPLYGAKSNPAFSAEPMPFTSKFASSPDNQLSFVSGYTGEAPATRSVGGTPVKTQTITPMAAVGGPAMGSDWSRFASPTAKVEAPVAPDYQSILNSFYDNGPKDESYNSVPPVSPPIAVVPPGSVPATGPVVKGGTPAKLAAPAAGGGRPAISSGGGGHPAVNTTGVYGGVPGGWQALLSQAGLSTSGWTPPNFSQGSGGNTYAYNNVNTTQGFDSHGNPVQQGHYVSSNGTVFSYDMG